MNTLPTTGLANIDRLFDRIFSPIARADDEAYVFSPKVDVKQKKDHYTIEADLPGVKKEDVNVSLEDGVLSISATTSSEKDEKNEDEKIIRKERFYGSFHRSFYVGKETSADKLQAKFENGVLKITLPYTETQTEKRIQVDVK